jgi:hypothetical protein
VAILETCCSRFASLSRAAAKAAGARFRALRLTATHPDWARRAAICETCHLRAIRCNISYCGKPFLSKIDRDPTLDGCGCPCREKAKSPEEHCPLDRRHQPAWQRDGHCTCKWCAAA